MKYVFNILLVFSIFSGFSQTDSMQIAESRMLFQEVKKICDKDAGALWGENLWSPLLYIDRKTRFIVANQQDADSLLKKTDDIYTGYFPKTKNIANSTVNFGGTFWTMVAYPLPGNLYTKKRIILHEMFHKLQPELNLAPETYSNKHIDKEQAKIYLKLEWEALMQVIRENNLTIRKKHLHNALYFRVYRRSLFPSSASSENAFEIHEGMPEYTAHRLVSKTDSSFINHILEQKSVYWNSENQYRLFGYFSGMLYACILDLNKKTWRDKIKAETNIGRLAAVSYNIPYPDSNPETVEAVRDNYNYKAIRNHEHNLYLKKLNKHNLYKKMFSGDSLVILPTEDASFGFSPSGMLTIDSLGTVFEHARIVDNWGILSVDSGGCLYSKDTITLPIDKLSNENNIVKSKNWKLTLNKGWVLIRKPPHYTIFKEK